MPPPYLSILDAEIDPDSPITTSLMFRLRDNLLASFAAQPNAPLLNRGAINIGGSGSDGNMVDATSLVGSGLYDFENVTLTLPKTFPSLTIIRATGTVNISNTIGAARTSLYDRMLLKKLGATVTGESDFALGTYPPSGDQLNADNFGNNYPCSYGYLSTQPFGLAGTALTRVWEWLIRHPLLGAGTAVESRTFDGTTVCGGGSIIILADGPIILTGELDASGARANVAGKSGAGGSIILVSGTSIALSGGILGVTGGLDIGHGTGNGAGGYIATIAPVITGSPTIGVNADGGGVGSSPKVGLYESINSLTQGQINALLLR